LSHSKDTPNEVIHFTPTQYADLQQFADSAGVSVESIVMELAVLELKKRTRGKKKMNAVIKEFPCR